jgi:hypothetical protein
MTDVVETLSIRGTEVVMSGIQGRQDDDEDDD